ncbi:PP2C family protein-serine/threonine phosphatase [Palleronia sp. LCG004]|uniref:PP2C family protein-serine/threonine phosphatase n=1 Tax=Palleronia sp. LCG004 TaxID=3079304 RepID=UPI002943D4FD|nr:SpoIIE family protein phosphatase [Palleronia sp. LCG004]WOI57440.1 SpoIIE family protein phosphatase [Palleronia sp. LCG004]
MHVVVVDDDEIQRTFISAILKNLGYSPVEAGDGERALDLVTELDASIVVCDLNMPGIDGHELTRRIRARSGDRYVHILMVTGQDQASERRRALESGVDDFMAKPIDTAILTVRMRAASRLARHEEVLAERNRVLEEAREHIERDLLNAAQAQRRLLPPSHAATRDCRFHSAFVPSSFVSGDMFGFFEISERFTGLYAMDVSGHGVHAALMSVAVGHLVTADYFRHYAIAANGCPDPAGLVSVLDQRFYREDSTDYFTIFCAVIDRETSILHYCQAGYPSPLIVARDGSMREIGDGGFPVALIDSATFETGRAPFGLDETLVLYSDGAIEAENGAGEPFGQDRLERQIATAAADAAGIPDALVTALAEWRAGTPLEDDLTIFACERKTVI